MASSYDPHQGLTLPSASGNDVTESIAGYALAALRVATGFIFLWAFFDKLFGLGYATPSERAWIHGGSPTAGFLKSVSVGPMQSTFHSMAGQGWADWLFMIGLLGIGLAVMLGVAMWPSAVLGGLLLIFMWLAEFPPAKFAADGTPTESTNPFVDDHLIEILILIALAAVAAGRVYGLGRIWASLPFVRDHRWLH